MRGLLPVLFLFALAACTNRSRRAAATAATTATTTAATASTTTTASTVSTAAASYASDAASAAGILPHSSQAAASSDTLATAAPSGEWGVPDNYADRGGFGPLLDSVERLLAAEKAMRAALVRRLEHASPAQADSLYLARDYRFLDTPACDSLRPILFRLADRCSAWGEPLPGDSLLLARLAASGIVFESIGEGELEARTERYYYYRIFRPYLTPETERLARLLADNDTLLFADAGLCLTPDELYRRCLAWERFLADYPRSAYRQQVQQQYTRYMQNLLFCTADNTPTFEWTWDDQRQCRRPGRIYDYTLGEIRVLVRDGDPSHTQRIVRLYLDLLAAQDYRYSESLEQAVTALYTLPVAASPAAL